MSHLQILESELQEFKIELASEQRMKLALYCDELARWNTRLNLTGLIGVEMVRRLIVEPAWIGQHLNVAGVLIDIGSGNGSPAIPLSIVCRLDECHLVEARSKRAAFLREMDAILGLTNNHVYRGRFEDFIAKPVQRVDWISLRGVVLTEKLITSMRRIATATTTVAWITSLDVVTPLRREKSLRVPFTHTEVSLFRLDQS